MRAYTEALRLDPEMASAYSNRGSAYLNLGQPELAITDADEAIRREPRQPVAYSVLGNAHHALGKAHQEREERGPGAGRVTNRRARHLSPRPFESTRASLASTATGGQSTGPPGGWRRR